MVNKIGIFSGSILFSKYFINFLLYIILRSIKDIEKENKMYNHIYLSFFSNIAAL
jgi:hypothetical protein